MEFLSALMKPLYLALMQVAAFWFMPDLPYYVFVNLVIKGIVFLLVWATGLVLTGEFKLLKLEIERARGTAPDRK